MEDEGGSGMKSAIIRGFRCLRDRCPEHDSPLLWTGETDGTFRLELVRYDCGCLMTADPNIMGGEVTRERVVPL